MMMDTSPNKVNALITNIFYCFLAVGFVVVSIFPEISKIESTVFTIPLRIVILMLSMFVIYKNIVKKTFKIGTPIIILILFWLFYGCKAYYSFQHYELPQGLTFSEVFQRIFLINFIPILAVVINKERDVDTGLVFKIIYYTLFSVILLNIFAGIPVDRFGRSNGIHSMYSISFGHIGTSLSLLSLYWLLFAKNKTRNEIVLSTIGFFGGLTVIYFANTRSPIVALIAGIVLMLLIKKYFKAILGLLFILLAGIAVIFISLKAENFQVTSHNSFWERIYNSVFRGDTSQRGNLYLEAIHNFMEKPFIGKSILFPDGMYPHNVYLEVLMSMGIIGFIMIVYIHFHTFRKMFLLIKNPFAQNKLWIVILFLQYYILSLTSYNIYGNTDVWFYMAMLWAANVKISKTEREKENFMK